MSPSNGDGFLNEFEAEVGEELSLAESSRAEEMAGLPVSQWPFDPMDAEREEVGLRGLLGAAEALEAPTRPDDAA